MKPLILAAFLCMWFVTGATANAVVLIEIKTSNESVTYSINQQRMTIAELSEWAKRGIAAFGSDDPFLIQPDSNTTFVTVFELLETLRGSGVKYFHIVSNRSRTPGGTIKRLLVVQSDQLKTLRQPAEPPAK